MKGVTRQRSRNGLVKYAAAMLERITGDPVRIVDKVYIQRWTGSAWVLALRRKR